MLFSSYPFFVFLCTALVVLAVAGRIGQRAFLLMMIVCSLVFYGWLRADYTLILVGSAGVNFAIATRLEQDRSAALFRCGVAFNLLLLGVFKYADFAVTNGNSLFHLDWTLPNIALPLALSFITFEQISFLSDVRSRKVARGDFLRYFAFVTFFPKLIAGPIIRYRELLPQFNRAGVNSAEQVFTGLCIFCFALFKKVMIADRLAPMVDQTVSNLQGGAMASQADAVSALLAYSLQIFFDFSAYSEMAIGIAWMFGIQLPVNFNSPYKAGSLIDFWRRWHITLSSFLRDYVYFPLGGSRDGFVRTSINLLLVMLVGGIWHGAAWTFVAWGFLHGAALMAAHGLRETELVRRSKDGRTGRLLAWASSMGVVLFAWILFRSPDFSTAERWFLSIITSNDVHVHTVAIPQRWFILSALLWVLFLPNIPRLFGIEADREKVDWNSPAGIPPARMWIAALAAIALVASIVVMAREEPNAFIYFQF
jgi:D-alanyl-lipoteichoic acid acyltransferase DltB (MBOAT superfamily)